MVDEEAKQIVTDDAKKSLRIEIVKKVIEDSEATSAALFKWIIASLLVVDSGALFALTKVQLIQAGLSVGELWPFAASMVLAIFSGFFISLGYSATANELVEIVWSDSVSDFATYQELFGSLKKHNWPFAIGFLSLLASTGLFIYGFYSISSILGRI